MAQFVFPPVTISTAGLATEATQLDVKTAVESIDTKVATETTLSTVAGDTTSLDSKIPAQGAALTAASLPVNIASDQTVPVSAVSLPLPTGAATEATLASLAAEDFATETTLSTVAGDTTSLDSKIPAQGAALTAASLPVNIASDQTVPVSAASLPLPTGAATEATLASLAAEDFATETTLASIAAEDFATSAKQDEQTAILKPDVVDQIDTTPVLDTSSTNIPGSASSPVEVVASTAAAVQKVLTVEDIGEFIGLYTGAVAAEVLKCVLPLGGGEVQVDIPAGTRISLRAMGAAAISTGSIAINFIG